MRTVTIRAATSLPPTLFTVPEAAWVADTEIEFVNKEVDKKVIIPHTDDHRLFDRSDVGYLHAIREFHDAINVELRRKIYQEVRNAIQSGRPQSVSFGHFVLRLHALLIGVDKRIRDINSARASVELKSAVRSGEPVVRGTRIPVRTLGEMIRQGADYEELAKEYALTSRQVELAVLYDQLHPRRGRPPRNSGGDSWADLGETIRSEIEELGEYPRRELLPERRMRSKML